MIFRTLTLILVTALAGCASKDEIPYNEQWSKAKNLTNATGMSQKIYDQQLPPPAYTGEGVLLDYKLDNISHPAYGRASGIVGLSVNPYGPYKKFYWGWTIPGISHHREHKIFAWMPKKMASSKANAQSVMTTMLIRSSLAILDEMGYQHEPANTMYEHEGIPFRQWYIGQKGNHCGLKKMNCVLSLYIPEPDDLERAPSFSFYSIANEQTWFFSAEDEDKYPRLVLAEAEGRESISENVFYQKLSARLPGWVYFYMAPNEVGIGMDNRTVAYPYLLEKGKPLLFVRPVN